MSWAASKAVDPAALATCRVEQGFESSRREAIVWSQEVLMRRYMKVQRLARKSRVVDAHLSTIATRLNVCLVH